MRALPLAVGRNEGGHYFHDKNITALFRQYNHAFLLPPCLKPQKGLLSGSEILHGLLTNKKNILVIKKIRPPPLGAIFRFFKYFDVQPHFQKLTYIIFIIGCQGVKYLSFFMHYITLYRGTIKFRLAKPHPLGLGGMHDQG